MFLFIKQELTLGKLNLPPPPHLSIHDPSHTLEMRDPFSFEYRFRFIILIQDRNSVAQGHTGHIVASRATSLRALRPPCNL